MPIKQLANCRTMLMLYNCKCPHRLKRHLKDRLEDCGWLEEVRAIIAGTIFDVTVSLNCFAAFQIAAEAVPLEELIFPL